MPELPEVETVKRGLNRLIIGKIVASVTNDNAKSFPNNAVDVENFLIGSSVLHVRRRAKVLIIDLSSSYSLVVHLKMTGQLVFVKNSKDSDAGSRWGAGHPSDSLIGELPDKSTRVVIGFGDSGNLFFNDQRKFGWMRLLPSSEVPNIDFMKKVGPEPLEADFTSDILYNRMQRRKNSNIKAVILDQTILAGVGNIYADESLWAAKIHPTALVKNITKKQVDLLHKEIVAVLSLSIEKGGSTDRNYVNAEGKKGSYIEFAKVFRREGKPCYRCGDTIIKIRVAGRGTHVCSTCQIG